MHVRIMTLNLCGSAHGWFDGRAAALLSGAALDGVGLPPCGDLNSASEEEPDVPRPALRLHRGAATGRGRRADVGLATPPPVYLSDHYGAWAEVEIPPG